MRPPPPPAQPDIVGARRALAINVRRLRRAAGLTLAAVAQRSGLGLRHIQKLEACQTNATIETLARLASALNTTISTLFERTSTPLEPRTKGRPPGPPGPPRRERRRRGDAMRQEPRGAHISIRVPRDLLARVDALIPNLSTPFRRATRSDAVRLVLIIGLPTVEAPPSPSPPRPAS